MILLVVQYLMNFMSLLVWKNEEDEGKTLQFDDK